MKVLVVEDDRVSRMILRRHLEQWSHEVLEAADGAEGLVALAQDPSIDVLITDWLMPNMNGRELVERARALHRKMYLPIIMLTGKSEKGDLAEGLAAGADAFLNKPFEAPELQAQLQSAERIVRLERRLAGQLEVLEAAHRRLWADLTAASQIQQALLPAEPPALPGLEFAWIFDACETIGGDMFNLFRLNENTLGMLILDVSGHGVPAALLAVGLSRVLTPSLQQGGILLERDSDGRPTVTPPGRVAEILNERYPVMSESGQFFTFLYGTYDLPTRRFEFVRAGHPGPLVVSARGITSHEKGGGPPIGIFEGLPYVTESIQLEPGDRVLFFTDGLIEAESPGGGSFGLGELVAFLSERHGRSLPTLVSELRDRIHAFADPLPQRDDITVVGFGIAAPPRE